MYIILIDFKYYVWFNIDNIIKPSDIYTMLIEIKCFICDNVCVCIEIYWLDFGHPLPVIVV